MLTRQLFCLRQKALGFARFRHVEFDPARPGAKAVLVVGAHERIPCRSGTQTANLRL